MKNDDSRDDMEKVALRQLKEAMRLLPRDEKEAFVEATIQSPALIETETKLLKFIQHEDLNGLAAAHRLAKHWMLRKEIFGDERTFLPMNLTGNGAMHNDDIDVLRSGAISWLPNDQEGYNVLFMDYTRLQGGKSYLDEEELSLCILRCGYYLLCKMLERETDGAVVLRRMELQDSRKKRTAEERDRVVQPRMTVLQMLLSAFPIRVRALHLLCLEQSSQRSRTRKSLPGIDETVIHILNAEEEAAVSLKPYGLLKRGLPVSFGGIWVHQAFVDWVDSKTRTEDVAHGLEDHNEGEGNVHPRSERMDKLEVAVQNAVVSELEDWAVANFASEFKKYQNRRAATKAVEYYDEVLLNITLECVQRSGVRDVASEGIRNMVQQVSNKSDSELAITQVESESSNMVEVAYGLEPQISESEAWMMPRQARVELEDELNAIPDEEKLALLRAREDTPHLFYTESDPYRFLRVESYDPVKAATRLVKYWELRREIFKERAYLPLDATGDGALGKDDLELLNTGFMVILPNTKCGKSVILFDIGRLTKPMYANTMSKLRVHFYILSLVSENEVSQREGFLGVCLCPTTRMPDQVDTTFLRRARYMIDQVLPLRLLRDHQCAFLGGKRMAWTEALLPVIVMLLRMFFSFPSVAVRARSKEEMLLKMKELGFCESGLPAVLGGSWSRDNSALNSPRGRTTTSPQSFPTPPSNLPNGDR